MEFEWKFFAQVGLIALLFVLEWFIPFFKGRDDRLIHGARNLTLAVINGLLGTFLFAGLVVAVILIANDKNFGIVNWLGLEAPYRLIVSFLLFDMWMYTWHRLNHRVSFFWRFHRVHHTDTEMDVTTGLRFHPIEIVLSFCARLIAIPLIGISLTELMLYEVVLQFVILFHHSNVSIPYWVDNLLRYVIVSPNMHRVHHSDIVKETDSNYSSVLSVWDRLFGSFVHRDDIENINYGLTQYKNPDWQSIPGMLETPFKKGDKS